MKHFNFPVRNPDGTFYAQVACPIVHSVLPTHFPGCMASCLVPGQVEVLAVELGWQFH